MRIRIFIWSSLSRNDDIPPLFPTLPFRTQKKVSDCFSKSIHKLPSVCSIPKVCIFLFKQSLWHYENIYIFVTLNISLLIPSTGTTSAFCFDASILIKYIYRWLSWLWLNKYDRNETIKKSVIIYSTHFLGVYYTTISSLTSRHSSHRFLIEFLNTHR